MSVQVVNIPIPNNTHHHRHFCTVFSDILLKSNDPTHIKFPHLDYIDLIHDSKEVIIHSNRDPQLAGNTGNIYGKDLITIPTVDITIEDNIFLLYDGAADNYIHHFFDFFGRCLYFEELRKHYPDLKLGVIEHHYQETGRSSFIKEWLDLYLEDKDVNLVVFSTEKTYRIQNLFISNMFYGFPLGGDNKVILDLIKTQVDKIQPIETKSTGAYISRQDTIKRGWYHGRVLSNELELIDKIKSKLGFDIIEMMDYTLIEKIQLSKSYKTIIQQSSASNINILFTSEGSKNVILTNPQMGPWLNPHCQSFASVSKSKLFCLDNIGICDTTGQGDLLDKNNYPWTLTNVDQILEYLIQIEES